MYVRLPYPLTMNGMYLGHYCWKQPATGIPFAGMVSALSAATAHVTTVCYANADRLSLNKCLYF